MVAAASIYQIFYSAETRSMLDPGFLPLDNTANERPDWREYWPIRRFLRSQSLREDHFYGFLAPRFGEKTGLLSASVASILAKTPDDCDVVLLSPFADQSAIFRSVIEHGEDCHAGLAATADLLASRMAWPMLPSRIVNTSLTTIYCNYFLAKAPFWRRWLELGEQLFDWAEHQNDELGERLRMLSTYEGSAIPMKVFIMERLASYLLAIEADRWKTSVSNLFEWPYSNPNNRPHALLAVALDALKIAYLETKNRIYLRGYYYTRVPFNQPLPPEIDYYPY